MGKFYYYPLNFAEFSGRTTDMNMEEIGCYITLINYQCQHKFIPKDKSRIRNICKGATNKAIERALQFFTYDNTVNGYICLDVLNAKNHYYKISEQRSLAGKAGAKRKWG